jgi:hypothetical protein
MMYKDRSGLSIKRPMNLEVLMHVGQCCCLPGQEPSVSIGEGKTLLSCFVCLVVVVADVIVVFAFTVVLWFWEWSRGGLQTSDSQH